MNIIEMLRQYKIGQFAIFDIVLSYVGILILSPLLIWLASKVHLKIPLVAWLWLTMPLSVLFHLVFQQFTPLVKMMANPTQIEFYVAWLVMLGMTYMGLRKISIIRD